MLTSGLFHFPAWDGVKGNLSGISLFIFVYGLFWEFLSILRLGILCQIVPLGHNTIMATPSVIELNFSKKYQCNMTYWYTVSYSKDLCSLKCSCYFCYCWLLLLALFGVCISCGYLFVAVFVSECLACTLCCSDCIGKWASIRSIIWNVGWSTFWRFPDSVWPSKDWAPW